MQKKVNFENSRGQTLAGVLHIPDNPVQGKSLPMFPAVIICHGFLSNKDTRSRTNFAEALAVQGFAALRFDFANSGDSEGSPENIRVSEEAQDVISAIDFLEKTKGIDPERIGVTGSSLGGMASLLAASEDTRIKAIVAVSPVCDFRSTVWDAGNNDNLEEWKSQGFAYRTNAKGERFRISYAFVEDGLSQDVFSAARKIRCPVLVIHGDRDQQVPVMQSRKLMQNLKPHDVLEVIEGGDHWYSRPGWKEKRQALAIEWFRKWLR